ncbi:ATP synthase I chain [Proteiniborus ethanoligenes]|uniref:ATP synthase I chain n=1 Tax=Proteiniborus ethanoligenes TaxID=415015 RepID=A0A1H3LS02_9FIRM|nr:ATP synthase subunit I [Proteiniborus ethanoligenes]SDY67327.1 ATP synthase I chain [Proteiniborus ethanoligenes]
MRTMEGNYQQKIIVRALGLALILSGIFWLLLPNPKEYIYGLIFSTSINVLNFRLMGITLEKAINMPSKNIMPYVVANYFVRYTIYGIMLVVSAVADYISLYTAILGLFMIKIVILSSPIYDIIVDKISKKDKSKRGN